MELFRVLCVSTAEAGSWRNRDGTTMPDVAMFVIRVLIEVAVVVGERENLGIGRVIKPRLRWQRMNYGETNLAVREQMFRKLSADVLNDLIRRHVDANHDLQVVFRNDFVKRAARLGELFLRFFESFPPRHHLLGEYRRCRLRKSRRADRRCETRSPLQTARRQGGPADTFSFFPMDAAFSSEMS